MGSYDLSSIKNYGPAKMARIAQARMLGKRTRVSWGRGGYKRRRYSKFGRRGRRSTAFTDQAGRPSTTFRQKAYRPYLLKSRILRTLNGSITLTNDDDGVLNVVSAPANGNCFFTPYNYAQIFTGNPDFAAANTLHIRGGICSIYLAARQTGDTNFGQFLVRVHRCYSHRRVGASTIEGICNDLADIQRSPVSVPGIRDNFHITKSTETLLADPQIMAVKGKLSTRRIRKANIGNLGDDFSSQVAGSEGGSGVGGVFISVHRLDQTGDANVIDVRRTWSISVTSDSLQNQ